MKIEIPSAGDAFTLGNSTVSILGPVAQTEGNTSSGTNYVLNTNTKKFHYPSCSGAKQMAEKNRKDVISTREDVIGMGYDPCGLCNL